MKCNPILINNDVELKAGLGVVRPVNTVPFISYPKTKFITVVCVFDFLVVEGPRLVSMRYKCLQLQCCLRDEAT